MIKKILFFSVVTPLISSAMQSSLLIHTPQEPKQPSPGLTVPYKPFLLALKLDEIKQAIAKLTQSAQVVTASSIPQETSIKNDTCLKDNTETDKGALLAHGYRYHSLHLAAYRNEFEIVKYLLEMGSDANERTPDNWTPLHLLLCQKIDNICQKTVDIARILLEHHADPSVQNGQEMNAHAQFQLLLSSCDGQEEEFEEQIQHLDQIHTLLKSKQNSHADTP